MLWWVNLRNEQISDEKMKIVYELRRILNTKFERAYIIGSFILDKWDPNESDIDLVLVDSSFSYYPSLENIKFAQFTLANIPYRIDLFLYTWEQFNFKIKNDHVFKSNIFRGLVVLWDGPIKKLWETG